MSNFPDRNVDEDPLKFNLDVARNYPDGIARFLMGLLRWYYSSEKNLGKQGYRFANRLWSSDRNAAGLEIDLDLNTSIDREKMPAIKISFSETTYEQIALGNRARSMPYNEGVVTSMLATTPIQIVHYARTKEEAYQYALLTNLFLRGSQAKVTRAGFGLQSPIFHKFLMSKMSAPEAVDSGEATPFYRCGLLLLCIYESVSMEYEESLPLKTLTAHELVPYCSLDDSSIILQ